VNENRWNETKATYRSPVAVPGEEKMQNQRKGRRRPARRQHKLPDHEQFLRKAHAAFCQLSEPAQTVLIIGLLLLLAWFLAHPLLLATLIKALLGVITTWITLKQL